MPHLNILKYFQKAPNAHPKSTMLHVIQFRWLTEAPAASFQDYQGLQNQGKNREHLFCGHLPSMEFGSDSIK